MSSQRNFSQFLRNYTVKKDHQLEPVAYGQVTRVVGLTLEAVGVSVSIGQHCTVVLKDGRQVDTEVVGFADEKVFLMPTQTIQGLHSGAVVRPARSQNYLSVNENLLGRIINGIGIPLDGKGPISGDKKVPLDLPTINPLERAAIVDVLDVGVRAINAMLTVGKGQRMGLFAGSGVVKSVLLGMMTRFTEAEVVVVGLVGERGREVKEFIDQNLGVEGLKRSVVVASPADDAPLMRLRAAYLATSLAEYYRDQGKNVLLLMDSLTRFGQAQREIALAIGEPPATKGYPPSVFSKIPQLVERAGNGREGSGSITAFYTVLTEGDDLQDPIADAARAILDGHIILSRAIAEEGRYPALDIEASISRAMPNIIDKEHLKAAQRFKQLYSRYQQSRDLISIGAYSRGSDPEIDLAIERIPHFYQFLQQALDENFAMGISRNHLLSVINPKSEQNKTGAADDNG